MTGLAEQTFLYSSSSLAGVSAATFGFAAGRPAQEGLYGVPAALRAVREALETMRPRVVVVQMLRCGWAVRVVRSLDAGVGVVFDAIDSMGLHFERAAAAARLPLRLVYLAEALRCRRRERELAGSAELTTAVSSRDLLALGVAEQRARVIPVSGREIEPSSHSSPHGPSVLLSGNLGYRPTVSGIRWFASQVWPRVLARVPEARWVLAGARPTRSVRRLARLPGVEVHADAPDLAPFVTGATVAVAPMATGSGVPMKVLEAWSAGVPVVAHPWAADGLEPDARQALAEASTPDQWVETLVRLLSDPAAARELGGRGYRAWQRDYSAPRVADMVREAVDAARRTRRLLESD